jgi:hypothetical protein
MPCLILLKCIELFIHDKFDYLVHKNWQETISHYVVRGDFWFTDVVSKSCTRSGSRRLSK